MRNFILNNRKTIRIFLKIIIILYITFFVITRIQSLSKSNDSISEKIQTLNINQIKYVKFSKNRNLRANDNYEDEVIFTIKDRENISELIEILKKSKSTLEIHEPKKYNYFLEFYHFNDKKIKLYTYISSEENQKRIHLWMKYSRMRKCSFELYNYFNDNNLLYYLK